MTFRCLIASLHLLALPAGLGAVWARSRVLGSTRSTDDLHRIFVADNLWGLAAAPRASGPSSLSEPMLWARQLGPTSCRAQSIGSFIAFRTERAVGVLGRVTELIDG